MSESGIDTPRIDTTDTSIDHIIDGLCALCIVGVVALGSPTPIVISGLVSIALGKRALNSK